MTYAETDLYMSIDSFAENGGWSCPGREGFDVVLEMILNEIDEEKCLLSDEEIAILLDYNDYPTGISKYKIMEIMQEWIDKMYNFDHGIYLDYYG